MPEDKISQMTSFLNQLKIDQNVQAQFKSSPLQTVIEKLQLPQAGVHGDTELANSIILALLNSPGSLNDLREVQSKREKNELNDEAAKKQIATVLLAAAPSDLREKLQEKWGGAHPGMPGFNPMPQLANLIVHVDVVAVVTKAAVVHEDYVFNGVVAPTMNEIREVADALARGP